MADKDVSINIKTKTDAKALNALNKQLTKLNKASSIAQKQSKALAKTTGTESAQVAKLSKAIKIAEDAEKGFLQESCRFRQNQKTTLSLK